MRFSYFLHPVTSTAFSSRGFSHAKIQVASLDNAKRLRCMNLQRRESLHNCQRHHLHRCAFGRHGGEAADIAEVNGDAFVLLGFHGLTVHQLNGYRPNIST